MRRLAALAAVAALAFPAIALAHVTVLPAFLEDGQRQTLTFSAPNERPPHAVTQLVLTVPAGIELDPVTPPGNWKLSVSGRRAVWRGGRTAPHQVAQFQIKATTQLEPAALTLHAVQRYDDGQTVPWTIDFTILPAAHSPKQHLWPALVAGVVGVVVIVGGLGLLRLRGSSDASRAGS